MMRISCSQCNATLKLDAKHAGKRGKCPKCGSVITIPAAEETEPLKGQDPPSPEPARSRGPTCPACGADIDPNAVVCVNCGTNLKTGTRSTTTVAAEKTSTGGDQRPSRSLKRLVAGGAAVVLVVVVGLAVWAVLGRGNDRGGGSEGPEVGDLLAKVPVAEGQRYEGPSWSIVFPRGWKTGKGIIGGLEVVVAKGPAGEKQIAVRELGILEPFSEYRKRLTNKLSGDGTVRQKGTTRIGGRRVAWWVYEKKTGILQHQTVLTTAIWLENGIALIMGACNTEHFDAEARETFVKCAKSFEYE